MPRQRSRVAETVSAMAAVVIAAAVIVGAIEYFGRSPDTLSLFAPAPALSGAPRSGHG